MDNDQSNRASPGIVFRLAKADLLHEWILTLCLMLAIMAVLSPLLLMFGLKFGIIDWGRTYLTEDPGYREIRPLTSRSFKKEWFDGIKERPDVEFVVPATRQIAASIVASIKSKKTKEDLDIIPTGEGDPLILNNGSPVPGQGECVLTHLAAEDLKAGVGDMITVKVSRIKGSRFEYGTVELKAVGILSIRASGMKSMYVSLDILDSVERFKDGQAVTEFGWKGSIPKAYPQYNGLIVVMPDLLTKVEESTLCVQTALSKIEKLDNENLKERAGYEVSPENAVYLLSTIKRPVLEMDVKDVRNKLRGKGAHLFPWIRPIDVHLVDGSGNEIAPLSIYTLSVKSEEAGQIGINQIPEWGDTRGKMGDLLKVMLPPGVSAPENGLSMKITVEDGGTLIFPVSITKDRTLTDGVAFVPSKLGGVLNLSSHRNVTFDDNLREFMTSRRGYAGFRLYAKSVDDVDGLRRFFEAQAIPVRTEMKEIKKVADLDKGMSLIFWLLAVIGITGSVASLTASLYASVERKKRELSVLRLIGMASITLFRFPIYQGALIAAGGFGLSLILFQVFSQLVNTWFRPYIDKLLGFPIEEGVAFCRLPLIHMGAGLLGIITVASLAAMISAVRIMRIEPAEALRDE